MRLAAAGVLALALGIGQTSFQPGSHPRPAAVSYLFPEQVTVPADKPAAVDLHFTVAPGLHINSHTPHARELVPTTLKFPETGAVRLAGVSYPAGSDFTFDLDPTEKLSVYTGEFILHAQMVAAPGAHLVEATLRYQACDNQTCMPPRSVPVTIDVIAK